MTRVSLAFLLLIGGVPSLAAAQQSAETVARPIFDAALAECRAEAAGDSSAPQPELLVEPGALTWVALDNPEIKDDLIVDFNHVLCSATFSLWHGTGGSRIHVVLNGETGAVWSGGLWRMSEFNGWPVLLIGRHGSVCGGYGAQPCVQAISAANGTFSVVQHPEQLAPE